MALRVVGTPPAVQGIPMIQVLRFKTGNGKILHTREIAGPTMKKLVFQVEKLNGGIREVELISMTESQFRDLPINKLAILEL
jgi:hypothetical protein